MHLEKGVYVTDPVKAIAQADENTIGAWTFRGRSLNVNMTAAAAAAAATPPPASD